MLRLRIELPDQPGSLGRVTWTLGVLGADVAQIYVLERDAGRALDDITLEWRGQPRDRLLSALPSIPGVRPVGLWSARYTPEAMPELGVMSAMVIAPERALSTLMDATPVVLAASWACVTEPEGGVLLASPDAPARTRLPEGCRPASSRSPRGPSTHARPYRAISC
ncbi:MAG: amino acid-binding protein [Jiangellaceae bacterium]|nr:amino acid-binding protein [Jiangellaceae bacterium]